MKINHGASELTVFAHFKQREALSGVVWSIFTAIEDDAARHVQGAICYASGAGVIPYRLTQKKRSGDA